MAAKPTPQKIPRVGIVVPTIGQRPQYLPLALESIRKAVDDPKQVYILLIGHKEFDPKPYKHLIDKYLVEPESNICEAINFGISSLPESIRYVNWLGDDDLLTRGSLEKALFRMSQQDNPVLVFGDCDFIDESGKVIWSMPSAQWNIPLLRFGPQLLAQPGALFTRAAFEKLGGLSRDLGWAFDFKLFLGLSKIGKCVYISETLANFRWHSGSLSVSRRRESVNEASSVRKSYLPKALRPISELWEWPVRQATYYAGIRLSKKPKNV